MSLLPPFGKVLERIVFDQLFSHVRPAISARQHGFFPGRSCATNLCTMLHTAWTNISAGSQTDVIYTDFSSAFQSVNHRLLLHKLNISYQISDKALDWIDSYLTGREQRVVVGGKSSEWVPVGSGTPEGGLLSPLLFACFVNDLPETLDVDTLLFADDVKMYRQVNSNDDVRYLQTQLDKLCCWSEKWGLKLNPTKCKVLSLTLRRAPVIGSYVLGGVDLERVKVMRDLGIMIDQRLTFGDHVDFTVRKANRALGLLMRTLQTGKNGRPLKAENTRALLTTYFANVRSVLEYGSVVWAGAAPTHIQRIERVQGKFLSWLRSRCRITGIPLSYPELIRHFDVGTMQARFKQHDIMFIRNVHRHKIDSSFLLDKFPLSVPTRSLRNQRLFAGLFGRVNTVKNCIFNRAPESCNAFLDAHREVDMWECSAPVFRKRVVMYLKGREL